MCNAYRIGKQGNRIESRFADTLAAILDEADQLVRPTNPGPIVIGEGRAETMSWGFRRVVQGKPRTINNARSDKLLTWTWKKAFENNRCLIPVSSFYEFTGPTGNKTALQFRSSGNQLLWGAGLWEDDPDHGRCYTLIMTEANPFMASIHDRTPALLDETEMVDFLEFRKNDFQPTGIPLTMERAINPFTGKPPPPEQFDLF